MKMKFLLQTTVNLFYWISFTFLPVGINSFQMALLWICFCKGGQTMRWIRKPPTTSLHPASLCLLGFSHSHRIPKILMTPVKNKYYMSSNPLLHDLISTPLNIMVENITPGPVIKPVSGVTSCQMNKKEDNIFRRVHHGDTVSADIFPRYTWDRWLSRREDYLLWSLKRFLLSQSRNMNNERAGLAEGGRLWQWADTKTRLAHQNIWISNTVRTLWTWYSAASSSEPPLTLKHSYWCGYE